MDYHFYFSIFLLLPLTALPPSLSQKPPSPPPPDYSLCLKPYECGGLSGIVYPFWGKDRPHYCGGGDQFYLTCQQPELESGGEYMSYTTIQMGSPKFEVIGINLTAYNLTISPLATSDVCSPDYKFSLSPAFSYKETVHNITLFYDCSYEGTDGGHNLTMCGDRGVFYYEGAEAGVLGSHPELKGCKHTQVPAEAVLDRNPEDGVSGKGFEVNYTVSEECKPCLTSRGACGSNDTAPYQFSCHCPDGRSYASRCPGNIPNHKTNHWTLEKKVILAVTGAVIAGLLIVCCFMCKLSIWKENFWWTTQSNQDIEAFLKNQGALTLKRYKFSDINKMTSSFKVKLGQGGFGAVYKGKLHDGSNVAVKMLNSSKGKGEEFINEVASISRTSHVNVVTLLGFCIEGRKKALIYEFMSNGSLDKFIYKKGHENTPSMTLSWDNLYQIAIGIARGLEYLHRGCNTRILHFDIKPHNILLDENFCPKISDFGLAKLCPRKESIISMSDARGTIGYVAPEVWNRHFGRVSHKSDVYSYGMMLLEIVGGRKNINAEASQTSEIYFPDWIYKRLEQDTHLGHEEKVAIEENEIIKRMTMVGLWCIQTIPNDRPTMSRVVEMLEGNINSLEMPPKPVLSSPIRSVTESITTVN